MYLRDVRGSDVDAYVQLRCDPVMMAHLGGPRPRDGMAAKVARDVAEVAAGRSVISMIVDDAGDIESVAGTVTLWVPDSEDAVGSEIGWMVRPEYQGRGLATGAVRAVLQRARAEARWGVIHAYPSVDNAPSNGVCRSVGFTLAGADEITFAGQRFRCNHWWIDSSAG